MTVAALYVDPQGVYAGLPDVEVWDEARDARLYDGPWPVVAHPPCAHWSLMGLCRGYYDGDDGGCFEAALRAVRQFGGVLEHPAHSLAWKAFALPRPLAAGWTSDLFEYGWTCEIDQRQYSHRANKRTWLYYAGPEPPPMRFGPGPPGIVTVRSDGGGGRMQRGRTPPEFRDVLLSMARSAAEKPLTTERDMSDPPYKPTVTRCPDCGEPYANLYAHIEACSGRHAVPRPVEPSQAWLDWWRTHWMTAVFKTHTKAWEDENG